MPTVDERTRYFRRPEGKQRWFSAQLMRFIGDVGTAFYADSPPVTPVVHSLGMCLGLLAVGEMEELDEAAGLFLVRALESQQKRSKLNADR